MFTIAEKLMLLARDDEEGTVVSSAEAVEYGVIGAILSELTITDKIEMQDEKISVIDDKKTGISFFDFVLEEINDSDKQRKADQWMDRMHWRHKEITDMVLRTLVEKGILKEEEKKYLFIFKTSVYPADSEGPEEEIRRRVEEIVYDRSEPDNREAMLLSLIKTCSLEKEVFGKANYKEAGEKIEKIVKDNEYGKAVKKSIEDMEAAILAATSVAVTTTIMPPNN